MRAYEIGPAAWREKFEACPGKEFSEPGYFEVHHLLVLCYMIQCDAYSDEYREKAHELLREFNRGLPPAEILRRTRTAFGKLEGSRLRKETGTEVNESRWGMTVLDLRIDRAEHYRDDVRRWAAHVEAVLDEGKG
mgnify:FL=1